MKMRSGAVSGASYPPDGLALADSLTELDVNCTEVGIKGAVSAAVVDNDIIPETAAPAVVGLDDPSAVGSHDRLAVNAVPRNINRGMESVPAVSEG